MRHLAMAHLQGVHVRGRTVAELGPGGSLGVGLAALLSGADKHYALDLVSHANTGHNLRVLEELLSLFRRRAPIPDDAEFPDVIPRLDSYVFPGHILPEDLLRSSTGDDRVAAIRTILANPTGGQGGKLVIRYFVPWNMRGVVRPETVDLVLSQAVMEHVDGLAQTYEALVRWLRPGGFMSHSIDYRSHGTARNWNGHWAYSDLVWKLIKGRHRYLINREPHSTHMRLLEELGLQILNEVTTAEPDGIHRNRLAARWSHMSNQDLATSTAFIQAMKRSS